MCIKRKWSKIKYNPIKITIHKLYFVSSQTHSNAGQDFSVCSGLIINLHFMPSNVNHNQPYEYIWNRPANQAVSQPAKKHSSIHRHTIQYLEPGGVLHEKLLTLPRISVDWCEPLFVIGLSVFIFHQSHMQACWKAQKKWLSSTSSDSGLDHNVTKHIHGPWLDRRCWTGVQVVQFFSVTP